MKMLKAGTLRHVVTVKRPGAGNRDGGGEPANADLTIYQNWPCSIEPAGAQESEVATQNRATEIHLVKGYTDPTKPIKATDVLEWNDGYSPSPRLLHVVTASGQPGLMAELVCGERK